MDDSLSTLWESKPTLIREFLDRRPLYERVCSEVAFIVERLLRKKEIEFAAVNYRAKTLASFAEKIVRKNYDDPLSEVSDLAGVRLVYLYHSDQSSIESLIENEFDIVEKKDKLAERDVAEFGYGALHYLLRLGPHSAGVRYADLKQFLCELQVRTVLQDAWSIVYHHISYKREAEVPKPLRRKLNSLAGLFETADDQFDGVRREREAYVREVRRKRASSNAFLKQDLNFDTLSEYLAWRFPKERRHSDSYLNEIFQLLRENGIKTLHALDDVLTETESTRRALREDDDVPPAAEVKRAMALMYPQARLSGGFWTPQWDTAFAEYDARKGRGA